MTATIDASPSTHAALADLVLVRMMLPSRRPPAPSAVRKDVGKLHGSELSAAAFDELREALSSSGLLHKGRRNTYVLTDVGRQRALDFLEISELPPRTNWTTVIDKYLFPRAAALSASEAAKLKSADHLAAFLLRRKHHLGVGSGSTVKQVLQAIVCKKLGYPEETTLDGLLCAELSKLLGSERLTKETLTKQLPLFKTGLTEVKADAVRKKVVREWLDRSSSPPSKREDGEPFDLTTFAATVLALAAKSPPHDRFHHNKVFISALWEASQREPSFPRLGLDAFKQRLLEANAQNFLHLSRADLVQAMDPKMVDKSETKYLNATFHFVLLEGDRP